MGQKVNNIENLEKVFIRNSLIRLIEAEDKESIFWGIIDDYLILFGNGKDRELGIIKCNLEKL